MIKKFGLLVPVMLPAALLLASCSSGKPTGAEGPAEPAGAIDPREEVVARVNGSPIYQADLNLGLTRYQQKLMAGDRGLPPEEADERRAAALEVLIENELLFQEAQGRGFTAAKEAVDEELAAIAGQFSGLTAFERDLARMSVTREDLRRDLERAQCVQRMIAGTIEPAVSVSAEEVRAYYDNNPKLFTDPERVHARHIFLRIVPNTSKEQKAEMRRTLEQLRRRALQGESFATLADQHSQDQVAGEGGDLGYISRGQLAGEFEKAVFALKTGEISGVVTSIYGYHLIQLVDRQPATPVGFERVKDPLTGFLRRRKVDEAVTRLIKELRGKAEILVPQKSR